MEKDCEIVFANKQTYKFNSKDLAVALKETQGKNIFAINTPWCVLQLFDRDHFEHLMEFMFEDHTVVPDSAQEDLQ